MTTSTEGTYSHILEGLISMHDNRIGGYEKASTETDDPMLESLFMEMASRSHRFKAELSVLLPQRHHMNVDGGMTLRGWTAAQRSVARRDRDALLNVFEAEEETALELYRTALHTPAVALEGTVRPVIEKQLRMLQLDQERIRALKEYVTA